MNLDKFAADLIEALLKDFCETFPRARDVVATMDGDVYGWKVARAEALADRLKTTVGKSDAELVLERLNKAADKRLRDEFAMRAPPMPEDFEVPEHIPFEYTSRVTDGWTAKEKEDFAGWGDWLSDEDISPDLLAKFKKALEEIKAIVQRNDQARLDSRMSREARWRWAYADAMLAARNPEPQPAIVEAQK